MMTHALTQLPAMAGLSILAGAGRLLGWIFKRFMAAPLTSAGLAVLTIGIAMSANNALFGQSGVHPAPFFSGGDTAPAAEPAPVAPVEIPPAPVREETTAVSVAPETTQAIQTPQPTVDGGATGEVTNADLADAQRKLQAMGLFAGEIDGFYGPETAEAIRAFEMRNGMTPRGAMARGVIDAILRADASDQRSIAETRANARANGAAATPAATGDQAATEETTPGSGQQALQALIAENATAGASPGDEADAAGPATTTAAVATEPSPTAGTASSAAVDSALIERVQRGLASLGFLHGRIDGVAGEATARAIRNFEVYHNYEVTGRVTPGLVDLLETAGADI